MRDQDRTCLYGIPFAFMSCALEINSNDSLARSRDKLKPLYIHYQSGNGYQTWQNGDLPWRAHTHKVTQALGQRVLQDHVTNYKNCISTTTVPVATKHGRILTYFEKLLPIELHDPLITWSCRVTWQTKFNISSLPGFLWPPTLAGWGLIFRDSFPENRLALTSRGLMR